MQKTRKRRGMEESVSETRGEINLQSASSSPGALAVLAHGQSKVHAAPRAHVSLVEGVVGQVGQANKRLFNCA